MSSLSTTRLPTPAELRFHTRPGVMTRAPRGSPRPTDVAAACKLVQRLLVHEFVARNRGVADVEDRVLELEARSVRELAETLRRLDPGEPWFAPRPVERRAISNCRHFTVLTCALLKRAGIPARARVGFASYFDEGWIDHWLVEWWSASQRRWVRTDAQLDQLFQRGMPVQLDPLDVPPEAFLSAAEAWQVVRDGRVPASHFGLFELRGAWFIAGNLVRDVAALAGLELLPWDVWGVMPASDAALTRGVEAWLDAIASVVRDGTISEHRQLAKLPGLEVPAVVHSARFNRDVRVR